MLYQVPALCPFAAALAAHARRRVVVETTTHHPQAWMADLWLRFHGIERPSGPGADDAEAALRETGLPVEREDHLTDMPPAGFGRREDAVAEVCQRLHLPASRAAEVERALGDRLVAREGLWSSFPATEWTTTLWWDVGEQAARAD